MVERAVVVAPEAPADFAPAVRVVGVGREGGLLGGI